MKIYKIFLKRKHIELQKIVKIYNIIESSNIPFLTPKNIQLSDSVSYKAHTCNNIFPKDIISYMKHQEENINSNINRDITINLIKSRSNVGKSSLINNLLNTELTKVSKEPGKTNFLQFINLPALNLSLVDCPGYGYANKSINERKKWDVMMQVYLSTNKKLERIIILIDPLVGITEMDQQLFKLAQKLSINFNIVFTKLDKIKRVNDIEVILKNTKEILMNYTFYSPFVIFTSSKLGLGFTELKCFLMFSKSLSENMSQTRRR